MGLELVLNWDMEVGFHVVGANAGGKNRVQDMPFLVTAKATLAGIAQTAGDLVAAFSMQLIPVLMSGEFDPNQAGCLRRFFHHITSQPYNLSFWVVFP